MIKVKRIDHVAIAVGDRDGAAEKLGTLFGLCAGAREHVADQGADVAFLHPEDGRSDPEGDGEGGGALEIIAPGGPAANAGLTKFLDRRGPGLHHICFEVD
ncbi:MAG: VOC family protein, partial [Pseudomonadota bacterium]